MKVVKKMSHKPEGDIWNIIESDPQSQHYGTNYRFDFSYISSEEIRNLVKDYVWHNYITGSITLSTSYSFVYSHFIYFNKFLELHNIVSLKHLRNSDIDLYISFLQTTLSVKKSKPLSYDFQRNCVGSIRRFIRWGQIHKPGYFPKVEIFTEQKYIGSGTKMKIDYIPDDVMIQINKALDSEENLYLKY